MMRMMIVVSALIGVVSTTAVEVAAQDRSYILFRVCEVMPGQEAAAQSIAGEFVDLYRAKFPDAVGNAWSHALAPLNHMHFLVVHPDLATYQRRGDALVADQSYQALVQKAQNGILGECTDELLRAVRPASQ